MAEESVKPKHHNTDKNLEAEHANHIRFFSHSTRLFRHHIPTEFVLLGIVEFFVLILSFYVGLELRFGENWQKYEWAILPRAAVFALVIQTGLIAFGAYQRQANSSSNMLAVRIGASVLLGSVLLGVIYYIVPIFHTGRGALALAVFVSFAALMAVRLLFKTISGKYDIRLRVLVLGAGNTANLVKIAQDKGEIEDINIITFMPMPGDQNHKRAIGMAQTPGALVKY